MFNIWTDLTKSWTKSANFAVDSVPQDVHFVLGVGRAEIDPPNPFTSHRDPPTLIFGRVVFLPPKSGIYHLSVPQLPVRSVPQDLHTGNF